MIDPRCRAPRGTPYACVASRAFGSPRDGLPDVAGRPDRVQEALDVDVVGRFQRRDPVANEVGELEERLVALDGGRHFVVKVEPEPEGAELHDLRLHEHVLLRVGQEGEVGHQRPGQRITLLEHPDVASEGLVEVAVEQVPERRGVPLAEGRLLHGVVEPRLLVGRHEVGRLEARDDALGELFEIAGIDRVVDERASQGRPDPVRSVAFVRTLLVDELGRLEPTRAPIVLPLSATGRSHLGNLGLVDIFLIHAARLCETFVSKLGGGTKPPAAQALIVLGISGKDEV